MEEFGRRVEDLVRECDPECRGVMVLDNGQQVTIGGVRLASENKVFIVQDLLNKGIWCLYDAIAQGRFSQ
jgi:myo-inositol catabolism protein IolC